MPWNMKDYPDSLKILNKTTRKKAIDIANDLLNDGYDEGRAIPIATSQAESWYNGASQKERDNYLKHGQPQKDDSVYQSDPALLDKPELVIAHDNGWAVQSEGAQKASKVFNHKSDAVEYAKEIAKNKETKLIIHDANDKIQQTTDYKN